MRHAILLSCLSVAVLTLVVGCGTPMEQRAEASEIRGTVSLTGGVSPKDLTVSFQPQQNSLPGGAKVGPDGKFTVKLTPGKYAFYFSPEANSTVPAFKKIPAAYQSASSDRVVSVSAGSDLTIEVK